MCGRYLLDLPGSAIADWAGVPADDQVSHWQPRWNIAPGSDVPVLVPTSDGSGVRLEMASWGLIPAWAQRSDRRVGPFINARSESAATKPAFRSAMRSRRLLVVMGGFYEWSKGEDGRKDPWLIRDQAGEPLACAGVWEDCPDTDGIAVRTMALLTREATGPVAAVHHRMPVFVPKGQWNSWIAGDADLMERITSADAPPLADSGALAAQRVDRRVNDARIDDSSCIEPPQPDLTIL